MIEIRRTNPLTEKMGFDASFIWRTTNFYLYLVNKIFAEIDEAENNKLYGSFPLLYLQLNDALFKLRKQDTIMKEFLLKYRELISA